MRLFALTTVFLLTLVSGVYADIYVPPGVQPGEQYHIIFVTDGTMNAEPRAVDPYDDFVNAQAGLNSNLTGSLDGVDYRALVSIEFIDLDARDHLNVSAPLYLFDGTKIADGASDLWDGSLDNPININQFGNLIPNGEVYTGSLVDGTQWFFPDEGVDYTMGSPFPEFSLTSISDETWTGIDQSFNFELKHYYAVSEVLTAPGAVPEPSSGLLLIGVVAGLILQRRYGR